MFNTLRQHLKSHKGDVYIQMLICTTVLLVVSVIIISVASSINSKLWLDEQLNDIVKIVERTGDCQAPGIEDIEQAIIKKFGGEITYEGEFIDDRIANTQYGYFAEDQKVQLNTTITVHYYSEEYRLLTVAVFPIATEINIEKKATSNVFFKDQGVSND